MMASRFVTGFRSTFLVASTSTFVQAVEPTITPRMRRFHDLYTSAEDRRCACGGQSARSFTSSRAVVAYRRTSPLGASGPAVLSMGNSAPRGGSGDKPPQKEKEGRGKENNLRNVMHFFESVMPLMFDSRLFFLRYNPPQMYTPNVILENHLREPTRVVRGLPLLLLWQNMFRLSYTMRYMANRLVILSQWIDPDEGTVSINFRILSVRKLNLQGVKSNEAEEALEKVLLEKAEWHDYILTLHVTNHDRVWKVVISQKISERTPPLRTRLSNPLLNLRRRVAPQQEMPLPV